mmetsp:Transcript_38837/g.97281  ORF Transcript_38837/g.97281 Transcript_38837/m.97281 type:complete len:188 (-) Transcript_38837:125-688(-)
MCVSSSRPDLEDSPLEREERHIEGPSAKIKNQHVLVLVPHLLQPIRNGSSGRLVDDTKNIQPSNGASVLGSLTLRVIEVCRHSHDGILDFSSEECLSTVPHLGEDHRRDLLGRKGLVLTLELDEDLGLAILADNPEGKVLAILHNSGIIHLAANQALGIENGVRGVGSSLLLGSVADHPLRFREGYP